MIWGEGGIYPALLSLQPPRFPFVAPPLPAAPFASSPKQVIGSGKGVRKAYKWLWVKKKTLGDQRFWSIFPFTSRVWVKTDYEYHPSVIYFESFEWMLYDIAGVLTLKKTCCSYEKCTRTTTRPKKRVRFCFSC